MRSRVEKVDILGWNRYHCDEGCGGVGDGRVGYTLTTTIASEIDIIESIRSHLFVKDYLIVTWELVMREMCRNMSGHSRWAVQPLDWR